MYHSSKCSECTVGSCFSAAFSKYSQVVSFPYRARTDYLRNRLGIESSLAEEVVRARARLQLYGDGDGIG